MEVRAPPNYYYYYYYYYYHYYYHYYYYHHHHLIRTILTTTTTTTNNNNNVKIFNSTQTFKNVFCLKFELILIIGSNNMLTEGARKVYRGRLGARERRVGQGCTRPFIWYILKWPSGN
jgi:Ca2+/Na+ antiporter